MNKFIVIDRTNQKIIILPVIDLQLEKYIENTKDLIVDYILTQNRKDK